MALVFGAATSDRVRTSANIANAAAFTAMGWFFPTTLTAGRRYWAWRNAADTNVTDALVDFGATDEITFEVPIEPTGNANALSNNANIATNVWRFLAFTYDDSDGPRIFTGALATAVAEVTYGTRTTGTKQTVDGPLTVGNSNVASPASAYRGRIGPWALYNRRFTLGELRRQQFRFHREIDAAMWMRLGWNGTTNVPDWSGNGNTGTITGATVGADPPLCAPFGADLGEAYEVAAAGGKPWLYYERQRMAA